MTGIEQTTQDNATAFLRRAWASFERGEYARAEAGYRAILRHDPKDAGAWHALGILLEDTARADQAIEALEKAVSLDAQSPQPLCSLAACLIRQGRGREIEGKLRRLVLEHPGYAPAWAHLGVLLEEVGKLKEAETTMARAIELAPEEASVTNNLGNVLRKLGRYKEALACHHRALSLNERYAPAHSNAASTLEEIGCAEEAFEHRRRMVQLQPTDVRAHSDLLFTMLHMQSTSPQAIFDEHANWGQKHAQPPAGTAREHVVDRNPDRMLRVGYVSPDFRMHAVSFFITPVLRAHDPDQIQVICYSDVAKPDEQTARITSLCSQWRDTHRLKDGELAELVREDRIDVLVDLAGHTQGSRLLAFAQKPAPVQVSYLGYPATTGMTTIDYRITDDWADPPSRTQQWHTETLIRLGRCFCCYESFGPTPPLRPPPCVQNGYVTFGALNRPSKITPGMIGLWTQILRQVPRSRLLLKAGGMDAVDLVRTRMQKSGINPARLGHLPRVSRNEHLETLGSIDIALDTFPYNGTATTCDLLWTGIPVVSLVGAAHLSRTGLSLLEAVGLRHLAAVTPQQYVQQACSLSADLDQLISLRRTLRERLNSSPLGEPVSLAELLQRSYRNAFSRWAHNDNTRL